MREGDCFDHYLLKEKIASGGMAEVFRAERIGLMGVVREVCIKCVRPELCTDADFVQMFIDEARLSTQLQHANIVAVDHFGQHEGSLFMCMEWVHGTDVAQLLKKLQRRPFPIDAAVFIVAEVLRALEYAHAKKDRRGTWLQIVHRDVTPHNVMVSFAGDVKLTDFGIAKASSRLHRTVGDTIKGKVAYMAPEQALGEAIDHRCDLFAVGVMAYELLAGRKPYIGLEEVEGVHAMLRAERPPLHILRPDAPPRLVAVIDRLLENAREARFPDAASVRDVLDRVPGMIGGRRSLQRLLRALYADEPHSTILPRFVDALPEAITEPIDPSPAIGTEPYPPPSEHSITERDEPTQPLDTSQPIAAAGLSPVSVAPAPSSLPPPTQQTLPPRAPPPRWTLTPLALASVSFVLAMTAFVMAVKSTRRPTALVTHSGTHGTSRTASSPPRATAPVSSPPVTPSTTAVGEFASQAQPASPTVPEATAVLREGALATLSVVAVPGGKISVAGRTAHNRGTFHLPPGRYHIRVEHPDMTRHERTVRLQAGEHETLRIHLSEEGSPPFQTVRRPATGPTRVAPSAHHRPLPLLSIP